MERLDQFLKNTQAFRDKQKSATLELILIISIVIIVTVLTLLFEIELVEWFYDLTREHEDWDLDELLLFILWLSVGSIIYTIRRMSDIKSLTRQIALQAYYDPITHLPNRVMAFEYLEHLVKKAEKSSKSIAVIFIDFDNFKTVNDTYGHSVGDELIQNVGSRLNLLLAKGDMLCRLGGDEFIGILDLSQEEDHLHEVLRSMLKSQTEPVHTSVKKIKVNLSIGISLYPMHGKNVVELIQAADTAMYQVKKSGKAGYEIFNFKIGNQIRSRKELEDNLRQANFDKEFDLVYQPQINTLTNKIIAYECLIRWRKNDKILLPSEFLKVAEEIGLIQKIDWWVFRKAIQETKSWLPKDTRLAINVSSALLKEEKLVSAIQQVLDKHKLPAQQIELEITEDVLVSGERFIYQKLNDLKQLGVFTAIDDFGVGCSSLSRLKDLQVNKLKISRSFISHINLEQKPKNIIKIISSLAQHLELELVIKGVEFRGQLDSLKQLGCHVIQGFYFCKPMKAELISRFDQVPTKENFQGYDLEHNENSEDRLIKPLKKEDNLSLNLSS